MADVVPGRTLPMWWLGIVPSAGIALTRATAILHWNPGLSSSFLLLLAATVLLAAVSAAARRGPGLWSSVPSLTIGVAGLLCLLFNSPQASIGAYFGGFFLVACLPDPTPGHFLHHERPLLRLAARDWGIPDVWRVFVAIPLRGAAQLMRFLDGLMFDQLLGGGWRQLITRLAGGGVARAGDPYWLPALALVVTTVVLLVVRRQ
jgi:hypothetical protein